MKTIRIPEVRIRQIVLIALALLLCGTLVASVRPQTANATAGAAAPGYEVSAPNVIFGCTPISVGVFANRVHVRCNPAYTLPGGLTPTISWFAYPTSDSANASRFLSAFTTARALGTNLTLYLTPTDLSGANYGCANADCRVIWGADTN
jgi:hypothetical protein